MVDLNCDLGESFGVFSVGPDDHLIPLITSANVACGGHAGDAGSMRRSCAAAVAHGVSIGAQVGYPDLAGFGRRFIDMSPADLADTVILQIGALAAFARVSGTEVSYVKPHGAMYHAVAHHEGQAAALVAGIVEYASGLAILGAPDSMVERQAAAAGVRFVAEGFADRRYGDDGRLVPRGRGDALITNPDEAAAQAVRLADAGIGSICIHSDTPGAVAVLTAVRQALVDAGHQVAAFSTC